jgi:hypothetical protein
MKHFGKLAVLGAVLAASASSAFAAPIVGTVVYSSGVETVTGQTTFTATATETVFKDLSNAFAGCAGNCLTFQIQVTDLTGEFLEHVTFGSFLGFLTQGGFTAVAGDVAPSGLGPNINNGFTFDFLTTAISNGKTSDLLYVQTNATAFKPGTIGAIDNSAGSAAAMVPSTVPEPNSLMLLGTGLVSAAGMLMRRRQTA